MMYPLAQDPWGDEEWAAVAACRGRGRVTIGPEVAAFEKEFGEYHGLFGSVAVNSGSSANLLAVAAVGMADARRGKWLVPAMGWSTTYAPLHQYGHSLVVVDVDASLGISVDACRRALKEHDIMGILSVNVLGVPADNQALRELCDQHGLWWIEDNCESLGARVGRDYTGCWGDIGTFSFFFSHHLVAGEGGALLTRSPHLYSLARSLRSHGWTRGVPGLRSGVDGRYGAFDFVAPGYNLRPMDLNFAAGRPQLAKLRESIAVRKNNAALGRSLLGGTYDLQEWRGDPSPMALPLLCRGDPGRICRELDARGVEHRPVIAGNILRQPVAQQYRIISYPTPVADLWHEKGLYVGIWGTPMARELFGLCVS